MEKKVEEWLARIDEVTAGVQSIVASDELRLDIKPSHNEWSVLDVLDHLVKINTSYQPGFQSIIDGNQSLNPLNRVGWLNKWFGQLILKSVQPDRKRKTKTMAIWEPEHSNVKSSVIDNFYREQDHLKKWIVKLMEKKMYKNIIQSPANSRIAYPLHTAVEIIVTHEERHMVQIGEILKNVQEHQAS